MTELTSIGLGKYEEFVVEGSVKLASITEEDMYEHIISAYTHIQSNADLQETYNERREQLTAKDNFWKFIEDVKKSDPKKKEHSRATVQVLVRGDDGNSRIFIFDSNNRSIHSTGILSNKYSLVRGELARTIKTFGCSIDEGLLLLLLQNNYNGIKATEKELLDMYHAGVSQDMVDRRKRVANAGLSTPRFATMKDKAVPTEYVSRNIINIVRHYNPSMSKAPGKVKWGISSTLILDASKKSSVIDIEVQPPTTHSDSLVSKSKVRVSKVDFRESKVHVDVELTLGNQPVTLAETKPLNKYTMKMVFNFSNPADASKLLALLMTDCIRVPYPDRGTSDTTMEIDELSDVPVSYRGIVRVFDMLIPSNVVKLNDNIKYGIAKNLLALELSSRGANPFVAKVLTQSPILYTSDDNKDPKSWYVSGQISNSDIIDTQLALSVILNLSKADEMARYVESTLEKYAKEPSERQNLSDILLSQLDGSTGFRNLPNQEGVLQYLGVAGRHVGMVLEGIKFAIGEVLEIQDYYKVQQTYELYVLNEVAQRELPEDDIFRKWAEKTNKTLVAHLLSVQYSTWNHSYLAPRIFSRDLEFLKELLNDGQGAGSRYYRASASDHPTVRHIDTVSKEMDVILSEVYEDAVKVMHMIREGYMQIHHNDHGKFKSKKVFEAGLDGNLWRQVLEHNECYEVINTALLSSTNRESCPLAYFSAVLPKIFTSDLPQVFENANVSSNSDKKKLSDIVSHLWVYANVSPVRLISEIRYVLEDTIQRQRMRGVYSAISSYWDMVHSFHQLTVRNYRSYERFPYSPHSLTLEHDILTYEAEDLANDIDEETMSSKYKALDNIPELWKPFKVRGIQGEVILSHPTNSDDLKKEGKGLNHCVGTYASRILSEQCLILFLRRVEAPEKPFITVEFNVRKLRNGSVSYGLGQTQGSNANGFRTLSDNTKEDLRTGILALANNPSAFRKSRRKKDKEDQQITVNL